MRYLIPYLSILLLASFCSSVSTAPPLELAKPFKQGKQQHDVSQYLASEKYDGVRATWTGKKLVSKSAKPIYAPAWFTAGLPEKRLDGELFAGRGKFNFVMRTVLDEQPNEAQWQHIQFMVFDAPNAKPFKQRYLQYQKLVEQANNPYLVAVQQRQFNSYHALKKWYEQLIAQGAEGVMLHRADAPFNAGRSNNILKLKPFQDSEAIVLGYRAGKGKHQGKMGALWVKNRDGVCFKIGTGFSDTERETPPPIGSVITYRYQGFTKNGKPRFARFMRVRDRALLTTELPQQIDCQSDKNNPCDALNP